VRNLRDQGVNQGALLGVPACDKYVVKGRALKGHGNGPAAEAAEGGTSF
jgi:hypothetical protein